MSGLLTAYQHQLLVFLLVATRISGLFLIAPIFGSRSAPSQLRVFLILVLAMLVTPVYASASFETPDNLVMLVVMLGREAALGIALGLAVMIFFSGMQLSGTIIGQMSGLQLAEAFDPSFDSSVPVFGQLLDLVAMGVFVALGGHRRVLAALLETFRWRPPGSDDFPLSVVDTLTEVTAESFIIGIRAAAPIMISLLLSVLILGLIGRTVPQLNVFAVGFNLNALLVLATLAFSLATVCVIVEQQADSLLETVRQSLSTPEVAGSPLL